MNRRTAWKKLQQLIEKFRVHCKCIDDIVELIDSTGSDERFLNELSKNLKILDMLGKRAVQSKNFEILKATSGIYSMKCRGKNINIRILYTFDSGERPVMLLAFYERDDSGKNTYRTHIPVAIERMREMEGIDYEE